LINSTCVPNSTAIAYAVPGRNGDKPKRRKSKRRHQNGDNPKRRQYKENITKTAAEKWGQNGDKE